MKDFFEEYGRTIVTVLIILGIILIGYTIGGNGKSSAFGRFTAEVADSMSGQANNIIDMFPKPLKSYTGTAVTGESAPGYGSVVCDYIYKTANNPDYFRVARFKLTENDDKTVLPPGKTFNITFEAESNTPTHIYADLGYTLVRTNGEKSSYDSDSAYCYVNSNQWKTYSIKVRTVEPYLEPKETVCRLGSVEFLNQYKDYAGAYTDGCLRVDFRNVKVEEVR